MLPTEFFKGQKLVTTSVPHRACPEGTCKHEACQRQTARLEVTGKPRARKDGRLAVPVRDVTYGHGYKIMLPTFVELGGTIREVESHHWNDSGVEGL